MKMQDQKLRKFKLYKNIANVLFILTIIGGSLALIASIIASIAFVSYNQEIMSFARELIAMNMPAIQLPADFNISIGLIITMIVGLVVYFALFAFIFKKVSLLFSDIHETQTPFTQKSVSILRHMSFSIFIYVVIDFIINIIAGFFMPLFKDFSFNADIGCGAILVGFLLLALSEIFDYGLSLQQDSESIL